MEIKPNNIYLGDCYKLIKEVPDKSIAISFTEITASIIKNYVKKGMNTIN